MDWRQEAVSKLRCYESVRHAVTSIPRELQQLRTAAYRMKGSAEECLLDNIVRRQVLQETLDRSRRMVSQTDRALEYLEHWEKRILQRMYIYPERGAVERLCQELGMERSSVYRNRNKALRKFTMALYGVGTPDQPVS